METIDAANYPSVNVAECLRTLQSVEWAAYAWTCFRFACSVSTTVTCLAPKQQKKHVHKNTTALSNNTLLTISGVMSGHLAVQMRFQA